MCIECAQLCFSAVDILEEVVDDEEEKPESSGKQKGKGKKRKGGPVV